MEPNLINIPNENKETVPEVQHHTFSKWMLFLMSIELTILSILVMAGIFFWWNIEPGMMAFNLREIPQDIIFFQIIFIFPIPTIVLVWFFILLPFYIKGKILKPRKSLLIIAAWCFGIYFLGLAIPAGIVDWYVNTYKFNQELNKHSIETSIVSTQEFLYSERTDNTLRIMSQRYDGSDKKFIGVSGPLPPDGGDVYFLSPKGNYYISYKQGVTWDKSGKVIQDKIINTSTGQLVMELNNNQTSYGAWSPDEKFFIMGMTETYDIDPLNHNSIVTLHIYDIENKHLIEYPIEYRVSYKPPRKFAWAPDSKSLYVTQDDGIEQLILKTEDGKLSITPQKFSSVSSCNSLLYVKDKLICSMDSKSIGIPTDTSAGYSSPQSLVAVTPSGYDLITKDVPDGISALYYVDENYIAVSNFVSIYFVDLNSGKIKYMRDIDDGTGIQNPVIFGARGRDLSSVPVPYIK